MTIEEFNRLDPVAAASVLASCAEVESWVNAVLAHRPFDSREALLDSASAAADGWTPSEVATALASHPRIGERPKASAIGAANAAHSAAEQAAVSAAGAAVHEALATGNAAYEERFGRVFLIRAAGRSPEQILAALTARLDNDDATEEAVVARELSEIALLRLEQAVTR
ncbi:MAG: 2-oxo-4-hydroxy-4-carboxy-5-ureidoimidazoline decarboxylase [Micropruina sp.]|uniref:2-oxo-4-hydroxy-4-carboxy-5-ureidoimidazoline decarboxylase n=1 Tax=Micropruina sp. TaxID=2737536 RepID=UPI0039E2A762